MKTLIKKEDLRKQALNIRKNWDFSKISVTILHKILNSSDFKNAKNIALYMPIKNEIDITGLLNCKNKNFFLPRCKNEYELEFCPFYDFKDLKENNWKIKEPTSLSINPEILDVIYVPAILANEKCYRLGYGKGYYDRFFAKYNLKAKKIIVLSKLFINNDFMAEKNDIQCDGIICE